MRLALTLIILLWLLLMTIGVVRVVRQFRTRGKRWEKVACPQCGANLRLPAPKAESDAVAKISCTYCGTEFER